MAQRCDTLCEVRLNDLKHANIRASVLALCQGHEEDARFNDSCKQMGFCRFSHLSILLSPRLRLHSLLNFYGTELFAGVVWKAWH